MFKANKIIGKPLSNVGIRLKIQLDKRRAPHELFPQKGVPHQFSTGLEILRKFIRALRFEQFEEHIF